MAALDLAHQQNRIERDPQGADAAWRARQRQFYQHDWVVFAKTPLGGPAQVLEYLSRYTHRTTIGNERIRAIGQEDVAFTVRADNQGGKRLQRINGPVSVLQAGAFAGYRNPGRLALLAGAAGVLPQGRGSP